ncbi:MAG TPA: metal-dependent hydrolase [Blastocatellia bacterium]|nr:metal-dependent hydrolase [Blastocatellia bacterium]
MDNITHTLVGAVLAETGLKRLTPLATTTLLIGANFPDIDIVVSPLGQLAYLEHHRGITHALVGIPLLSLLLAALVYVGSRWWQQRQPEHKTARFGPLLVLSLVSISTHPLLDFTNSYGWRPYLPWNRQWFYGDIDFVVDPWLWAGLGGVVMWAQAKTRVHFIGWGVLFTALAVPVLLFGGTSWGTRMLWLAMVGGFFLLRAKIALHPVSTSRLFRGVILALLFYFGVLTWVHFKLLARAQEQSASLIETGETVMKVDALPLPANPLRKSAVITTDKAFYIFDLHLLSSHNSGDIPSLRRAVRVVGDAAAVAAALREPEFQAFLRFARFPVIEAARKPDQTTEVKVRDIRFELDGRTGSSFHTSVQLDAQMRRIVE